MKNNFKMFVMVAALGAVTLLSGCFWAGLGLGAAGGATVMHMYDNKPGTTHRSVTSHTTTYGPDSTTTTTHHEED